MKIVIIGGVAGGASTAARARRLSEDAEIVVFEKDRYVSFANCGLPYHIGGDIRDRNQLLLQTPESLRESLNIDVRIGYEATEIDRENRSLTVRHTGSGECCRESYDKLVLCPGADALRPPISGIDHRKIFVLRNLPDMDAIKSVVDAGAESAIVVGGGFIGIEMAEAFRHCGMKTNLVELQQQVMPPLDPEMALDLTYHLESNEVRLHLGHSAESFKDAEGRVEVILSGGDRLVADLVVLAIGVRPASDLARSTGLAIGERGGIRVDSSMRTSDPDIYAAGDAVEVTDTVTGEAVMVPLAGPANRQGRIIADHIFGRRSAYQSTQGTAVVKVFEMTAGNTGASEKTLKRRALNYRKVYLHPSGHASYYPGTAPMHIKILFRPDDGKLLGAQVVGYDGVDKRIDVFATAIRAGLTVFDLEHLELAYAPPYGSAKDPVNMAGFIAANLLRGDLDFWYAEDFPEKTASGVYIDVRSRHEYEKWHIPDAIHIPLREIRSRRKELTGLAAKRPLYLYCRVGFRSYLAYRIIRQWGFENVSVLCGGSKTLNSYHRTILATGKAGVPFVAHAEDQMSLLPRALDHA